MKKLKKLYNWIIPTCMFFFMEGVNIFFPYYPAWVMKYGKKARAIVYGYWLVNKPIRFYNFLSSELGTVTGYNIDKDYATIHLCCRKTNTDTVLYLGNFNQFNNDTYLRTVYNRLRYYFFYNFVWIWLDDLNNIVGINKSALTKDNTVLASEFLKLPIAKRVKLVDKIKLYPSVFDRTYQDPTKSIELNKFKNRIWFVIHQYLYNYLRDKAVKSTYEDQYCLGSKNGFIYNPGLDRACLTIIGYNIILRKKI